MHGYLSDSKIFYKQINYFKKYFEVYLLDLKGFGENENMDYPYSLSDYSKDVETFIKQNNIVGTSVIAHSFGGRIVIDLASKNPKLFSKIVLTGSAGLKPKRKIKYRLKKLIFKFLKIFIKKEKLSCFYSSDYNKLSPIMKESFKKIINEHLDEKLKYIKNKTLIINGELDRETPPYMAKRLNQGIENSTLKFIKGAGHFSFIDKPYEFNREVGEFLLSN